MQTRRWFVQTLAVMVVVVLAGPGRTDPPAKEKSKDSGLPDLVEALKGSPGCLGVETAKTGSGKTVLFAWFEDRKAALAWYHSDTHRDLMKQFFPGYKSNRKPLADVPDDSSPIMAVASVTLKGPPTKENPLPFKQISIELYRPLGGGLSFGGKFAPDKMKVPASKERAEK